MARIIAPSFSDYSPSWIRPDILAGLTVWAVLVPESLAYATIAGVPPVVGLYAAVPALVLYSLLGSSRHLIVAPMSATAALSAGVVGSFAAGGGDVVALTTGLAIATGIVALIAGLLRLGFLAAFISEPVLRGFIIGLALTIIIGQLPPLVGVEKGSGNFFEKAWDLLRHLGDVDALTILVGVSSLVVLLVLRRVVPLLPGSLAVALVCIGLTALLDLDSHGLAIVGHIDAGLPTIGFPDVTAPEFRNLIAAAVGVMLVGFAEGLGAAKTYAAKSGYDIDPNRELLGLGISNLGSGLASGMVVNGSLSKTAVNGSAGAKSQISAMTAAVLTLLTLLFMTRLFSDLPEATLAAIVIAAVIELVDISALRRLWRARSGQVTKVYQLTARADFVGAVAALIGVLVFDTLPGLVIGIAVSVVLLIARTSRPHIASLAPVERGSRDGSDTHRGLWVDQTRNPEYAGIPGILVVRVEASLLFANADYVREHIRELAADVPDLRLVVIDGRATPSVDVTATAMLTQLRGDLRRSGADLALAGDVGQVRDVLTTAAEGDAPVIYPTVDAAIAAATEEPPSGA
ncbi:SulP family inorganic anion transporter [Nocardioides albus]|uniref:High affinity sulfate transporter 1 n=1 Tax=Nocardioides albus TaxID=1841 RepID=A0A7W5A7Q7_9ACTN|nr:SulP family inorganic anion transporter [Nocardioides albus]MBB3091098.1 high affinity sulfate transporter 1 [Nocardioides albus]GGU34355.1 DNA repair protein HhH-GPD [Nocardioides albus]